MPLGLLSAYLLTVSGQGKTDANDHRRLLVLLVLLERMHFVVSISASPNIGMFSKSKLNRMWQKRWFRSLAFLPDLDQLADVVMY